MKEGGFSKQRREASTPGSADVLSPVLGCQDP